MNDSAWVTWHDEYDDPESYLSHRLALVRSRIRDALDASPAGQITVISMCAGQGRDLLGVLATHPRRNDVRARLVELDEHNVAYARATAREAGLDAVDIVLADASQTNVYAGMVPADLVLACGVFGNITDADIQRTVRALPMMCAPGAIVIWTRHRREPDLTPTLRGWFADAGFHEVAFDTEPGFHFSVGTHRYTGEFTPFARYFRLFTFVERS